MESYIGREKEKRCLIEALVAEPNNGEAEESVSVIPIVGLGGIGKTVLARMVFDDKEVVEKAFGLRVWVYVTESYDRGVLLGDIFTFMTNRDSRGVSVVKIKEGIQESIKNEKFLLVLDNMWIDIHSDWLSILWLLKCGKSGSKVIVTTRSHYVAQVVITNPQQPFVVGPLSEDESWGLFRRLAFRRGSDPDPCLFPIGKELLAKCGNVPLAIKAVANMVYGHQTVDEWMHLRGVQLSNDTYIMSIMKASYDNLRIPELKQCFAYCALFPKGHVFKTDEMVFLWMAQGFLNPTCEIQSVEAVGRRYIEKLLMSNLLQDPLRDDKLKVVSFKMHVLVHDLALHVAGENSIVMDIQGHTKPQLPIELLHVSFIFGDGPSSWEVPPLVLEAKQVRSVLHKRWISISPSQQRNIEKMTSAFKCLRALSLSESNIKRVPGSAGKSKHLRYLDLSWCEDIKYLPGSITKLSNLQTLNLHHCSNLRELPRGFSKLINLRHLDITDCVNLFDLPRGFGKLEALRTLPRFIVGKGNGIDALANMHLQGKMCVEIRKLRDHSVTEAMRVNLMKKQGLTHLTMWFMIDERLPTTDYATRFLEYLQPPPDLKTLVMVKLDGQRLSKAPKRFVWMDKILGKVCWKDFKN